MKKVYTAISVLVLLLIVAQGVVMFRKGQAPIPKNEQKKLTIVTTIYPFTDLAQKIAGDKANVTPIIPGGVEPHDYEPTAQDIITIKNADIFVYNGLPGIEPWLNKVLPFIPQVTQIDASKSVALLEDNPHYWMDPENNQKVAAKIRDVLAQKDPSNADTYTKNTAVVTAELQSIDTLYMSQLASCPLRDIVVSHDAYEYMAKRYSIATHAIAGLSPENEPDARTMTDLVNLVRQKGIPYILFETLASPKIAETIASETGTQTLVLNPLEGLTEEEIARKEDMVSIMKQNLETLKKAMKCSI